MNDMNDLEKENKELKESLEFKSDLISMTAHQLRTSMSAVKWVLKMLLDGDLGTLTDEQRIFLKKTEDSNEKMIGVVSDMIEVNKEEGNEIRYSFSECDLKEIVDSVFADFKGEAAKKSVSLVCHCDGLSRKIEVDHDKMVTVVQGLIENAIKYNKEGGSVTVSASEDANDFTLSVADTGIGISEKEEAKIFEKFFRTKNAQKHDSVGSGLGLFVIKRIVDKHNGQIWFESKEGVGTTFYVRLPFKHA